MNLIEDFNSFDELIRGINSLTELMVRELSLFICRVLYETTFHLLLNQE